MRTRTLPRTRTRLLPLACARTALPLLLTAFAAACNTSSPTPPPVHGTSATPTPVTTAPPPATQTPAPPPPKAGGPSKDAVQASNCFGFDLYQKLRVSEGNLAFSPASISLALSMTYGGAKGETATEMANVMHLPADAEAVHGGWATVLSAWAKAPSSPDGGAPQYEIAVANRLFGEKGYTFEKPFLTLNQERYGAPLELLDFATAHEKQRLHINSWVKEQTRERIVDLIPPRGITADTRLVLTNALYFKAAWRSPFTKDATAEDTFTTAKGQKVKVPMMHQTEYASYGETDEVQLLELGYVGGRFATLFVLPKEGKKLGDIEAKLGDEQLKSWLGAVKGERVSIALPRFKLEPETSMSLGDTLQSMGMKLAFQRGAADFTGMTNPPNPADRLYISKVFHKAFVAMDEAGTEAAAATAVVMARVGAAYQEPKKFKADRPFLFLLRDKQAGLVMFVGRVDDPSAS